MDMIKKENKMAKGKKTKEGEVLEPVENLNVEIVSNDVITEEVAVDEIVDDIKEDTNIILEVEEVSSPVEELVFIEPEIVEDVVEETVEEVDTALFDIEHELYETFSIAIKKILVQSKALKEVNDSSRKTQVAKIISDVQSYLDSYKEKIIDLNV